jgi:DNA-binding transcriptional regulator YhcF (GntR family)
VTDGDGLARLRLDARRAEPLSTQLVDAIRRRIERGALAPGDRLPPVRILAERLDLAPNTVAKAYRELEDEGRLIGRGRLGTFVRASAPSSDADGRLVEATAAYVRRARQLGASDDDVVRAVRRRLGDRVLLGEEQERHHGEPRRHADELDHG